MSCSIDSRSTTRQMNTPIGYPAAAAAGRDRPELAMEPDILLLDEVTSALDLSWSLRSSTRSASWPSKG